MSCISPTLAVKDMKQTIGYYRDSLGFKIGMAFPNAGNPEHADLSRNGMVFMFLPVENVGIGRAEKLGVGVNIYMQIDGDIDKSTMSYRAKALKL